MQDILPRRRLCPRRCIWSPTPEVHSRKWRSIVAVQALDQLTAGVIVTDSCAEVVEMNRAAESIVQLEDGLLIRNDRLCGRRAFETGKVTKLIAGATVEGRSAASAGRMLIGRCDGLPAYVLSVAPLRIGLAVDNQRLAMVVIVDPAGHSPSAMDLAEFFGLSPAEARLAAALLTGKRLARIAADSGIRITTVRTQLGSILRKVGAERQSDLIRILSGTGVGSVSLAAGWFDIAVTVAQLPLSLAAI
jgi:DNA-binding CsgD family transcriptional regulator